MHYIILTFAVLQVYYCQMSPFERNNKQSLSWAAGRQHTSWLLSKLIVMKITRKYASELAQHAPPTFAISNGTVRLLLENDYV